MWLEILIPPVTCHEKGWDFHFQFFFFEDYIYVTSWHFMGLSNILSGDNDVYQTLYKKRKTQAVSHSQLSKFIEKMCR